MSKKKQPPSVKPPVASKLVTAIKLKDLKTLPKTPKPKGK